MGETSVVRALRLFQGIALILLPAEHADFRSQKDEQNYTCYIDAQEGGNVPPVATRHAFR